MFWVVGVTPSAISSAAEGGGLTAAVIVPALVSTFVAVLTTGVTVVTLVLKSRGEAESRRHETRLRVIERKVDALERAWVETFAYEQSGAVRIATDEIVRMSMWMPDALRSAFVRIFSSGAPKSSDFKRVRDLIQTELKVLENL